MGGSYVQATAPNIANINIANIINNLYPQSYPSSPSPSNSNNPYAQYYPPTSSSPSNSNNSSTVPDGTGGLFSEISFGYKYFLGKKRMIGFRHSLFFGYQVGSLGGLIAFLPYGFDTDLLINLWKNDDLDKRHSSTDYIIKRSSGFVIGVNIGASTWFASSNFNQVKSRTIFQFSGKFGVRWNRDIAGIELGVKVPAFKVNYYSDNYGNKLDYKRLVSVYLNCAYTFKD